MLYMPESPRYLMHKGRTVDAYMVWKRIRGIESLDSREEFFVMKVSTEEEEAEVARGSTSKYPWVDFFTYVPARLCRIYGYRVWRTDHLHHSVPRCRRAIIYANMMIFLGQFTGINAIM